MNESTALGAAICAGVGIGIFSNIKDTAKELVKWEKTLEPDEKHHKEYVNLYAHWKEVYKRALTMAQDGLVKPLWWAYWHIDR